MVTAARPSRSLSATRVTLGHYKATRFWAIWINDELLAVTVYRKGARAMLAYMGLDQIAVELKRPPNFHPDDYE